MNYSELKTAILSDSHREDYTDHIDRFVDEAEAFIFARLQSYGLEVTLTDADRSGVDSPVYTLPEKLVQVRYVIPTGCKPLDQVDETMVSMWQNSSHVMVYAVRPNSIIIAGLPSADSEFVLQYFGLPAPLTDDDDTNTLLNDYPQLYKEAAQISVFKRAKDYEAAQIAQDSVMGVINEINRKVRKQLGGARSSNPYNTDFRSSY